MMYDLLPVICWYLCDAWQDVRSVTCDLHGKMNELLPLFRWYLCEAWQDVRLVACDVLWEA